MKKTLFIILLILNILCLKAQKNIFVLVDVSKSVKSHQLDNAKTALREIFTTGNVATGNLVGGSVTDLQFYKLQANDKVAINTFGNLQTSANIVPILKTVNNLANDIDNILGSIQWYPKDNTTYLTLARAKIAEFAKSRHINNYVLIEISDNINDDYGPNGRPDYEGNIYLKDLIDKYNTTNNKVTDNGWTKVALDNTVFRLSFTSGVNISAYTPPKFQATNSGITITFPSQTKKGAELEINDASFNLTWVCLKCNPDVEYSVHIEGYDGNTYSETIDTINADFAKIKLTQNGFYQFVVSARNCDLIPDTAFVNFNLIKDTKIKINSPAKGTSKKPTAVKSKSVNVSWFCPDCDDNTRYTVTVSGINNNRHKEKPRRELRSNSTSFNLPSGEYKITVAGTNGASSDTTYIEVGSGGGAGWLLVLLLLAGLVGIYLLLKKMKDKKSNGNTDDDDSDNVKTQSKSKSSDTSDDEMF
jgi:hypothetical protein